MEKERKKYDSQFGKKNYDYKRKKYKRYIVLVRKDDDEIINKLNSVKSKNKYINNLINEDIKNG